VATKIIKLRIDPEWEPVYREIATLVHGKDNLSFMIREAIITHAEQNNIRFDYAEEIEVTDINQMPMFSPRKKVPSLIKFEAYNV